MHQQVYSDFVFSSNQSFVLTTNPAEENGHIGLVVYEREKITLMDCEN